MAASSSFRTRGKRLGLLFFLAPSSSPYLSSLSISAVKWMPVAALSDAACTWPLARPFFICSVTNCRYVRFKVKCVSAGQPQLTVRRTIMPQKLEFLLLLETNFNYMLQQLYFFWQPDTCQSGLVCTSVPTVGKRSCKKFINYSRNLADRMFRPTFEIFITVWSPLGPTRASGGPGYRVR